MFDGSMNFFFLGGVNPQIQMIDTAVRIDRLDRIEKSLK